MHVSNEPHINHVQTYSPHVHATIINYDRPLEKGMFIWFMRRSATQKFFRAQKTQSLFGTPQIEISTKHYLAEKVPEQALTCFYDDDRDFKTKKH